MGRLHHHGDVIGLGTLPAVYGIFINAIGWEYALWIWVYALVWFVFNDIIKMWTYRILRTRSFFP